MAIRNTILIAVALLLPFQAQANHEDLCGDYWEAHLKVTDGLTRTRVSFGVRPDATEGYDRNYEVKLLAGGGIRAFFEHWDWPEGAFYVREVEGPTSDRRFEVVVDRMRAGRTVTLTWDLQWVPYGCERVDLFLTDPDTGEELDLRRQSSFSFLATTTTPRRFAIRYAVSGSRGPAAPTMMFAREAGRSGQVVVHWVPSVDASVPVAAWHVYRQLREETPLRLTELPIYETTFQDRSLPAGITRARYTVRALNADLCPGEAADPVELTSTAPLTGLSTTR